ncbi:MAG: F-type H+-transporting ATPase subunit a [Microbacteriaceae bacterium]|nr:F-type H+-transporting ATPase subunit a [Microbacteriaceae bacterium]
MVAVRFTCCASPRTFGSETVLIPHLVPAAAAAGGFEPPTIADFFPPAVLFGGTPFALNRVMLIRLIVVALLALWLWRGTRRMRLVPGRGQVMTEFLLGFVRNNIAIETLGEEDGRRFMPIIMTMFFLVFGMNITGAVPGLQIAGTAVIGLPLILALVAWVLFIYAGFRKLGWTYLRNSLFLPGVPWPLYFLLTPLEILSTFIVRPITLTMRLLMNMVSGHLLLALVYSASSFFLFTLLPSGNLFGLIGVGTVAFGIAYLGFEIFVAALQAYVFAFLTAIYIQLAVAEEH